MSNQCPDVQLNEHELPDDYPMFPDYLYCADGKPFQWQGGRCTAEHWRATHPNKKLTNCDIKGRNLWHLMV